MGALFRDAYGEVIVWRVALVIVLAVAAAVALAFALFGPKGGDEPEDDGHVELPEATRATTPDAGIDAWLAGVEGSDRLSGLEHFEIVGLMHAVESWSEAHPLEDARLSVIDVARDGDGEIEVRLRVAHAGGDDWLEATLPSVGTWQVSERPEGFGPTADDRVAASDGEALAQVMDPAVASEVARQLLASGIEGADAAWTTPGSVSVEDGMTRMTIWFPREGGDPEAWDAAYEESFGMLEIRPSAQEDAMATEPAEVA